VNWSPLGARPAVPGVAPHARTRELPGILWRVSDGTRTRDRLDHNQELYRLSYAHRDVRNVAVDLAAAARSIGAVSLGG
jgi:hypothetical protein